VVIKPQVQENDMITHTPDNRAIFYRTKGTGPELMLVHGGWPVYFEPLVEVLSPHYCCISFDRLGFRRSTHLDRNTTVEEQVNAIKAVHESITSAPVWIFGWSSGGNFALAYALSYPDHVKGIILVEPALYAIYPPEKKPPEVERMQNQAMPLFQQGEVEKGWNAFVEIIFGIRQNSSVRPPLTEEDLEIMRSFGYDQPVVITWFPSEAELNQVTQPVLIIEGDQSPSILRNICQLLDSQLINSELDTLEGQDHGMPNAAPKLVADKIMTFISERELNT
jgi:pimeloyl-ACP methyl ester carboxylesterase